VKSNILDEERSDVLGREETKRFYDRFGRKQDWQAFYEDRALHALIEQAHFNQANAVIEFGCGTGRLAERLLAMHLPVEATYWGCDISRTMVGLAERRVRPYGHRATIAQTNGAPDIPLPDQKFDRFVSTYVLDILSEADIHRLIAEAKRVLRTEGVMGLVSITEGANPLSRLLMSAWRRIHKLRPSLVGGCRPIKLLTYVTPRDWEIVHYGSVVAFGITSEVLVARKTVQ
jgi:ubiquinone/menaquinone biosynthesis C-methylase UbiE